MSDCTHEGVRVRGSARGVKLGCAKCEAEVTIWGAAPFVMALSRELQAERDKALSDLGYSEQLRMDAEAKLRAERGYLVRVTRQACAGALTGVLNPLERELQDWETVLEITKKKLHDLEDRNARLENELAIERIKR